MKTLFTTILFVLLNLSCFSQDNLSVIYSNIVSEKNEDVFCKLYVAKQLEDSSFVFKTKEFRNQTIISLSEGEYRFYYCYSDTIVFIEDIQITKEPLVMVLNVLVPKQSLIDFNLDRIIFATAGMYELSMKKDSYMEF